MLSGFRDDMASMESRCSKAEFSPKYGRPCNAIAWNEVDSHRIAIGLDKVRSDFCTLIWDVEHGLTNSNQDLFGMPFNNSLSYTQQTSVGVPGVITGRMAKPVHELANSEATVALAWCPGMPSCLLTGTGFKWLRLYDLRTNGMNPISIVAHTKGVRGVVFDSHREHLVATYSDAANGAAKIWDIRKLDATMGPVASIQPTSKYISEIGWSPVMPGVLMTASSEESWVSLWDVNTNYEESESAPYIKQPFQKCRTQGAIVSFSWQNSKKLVNQEGQKNQRFPSDGNRKKSSNAMAEAFPNRLLVSSRTGDVRDIFLHSTMPMTMSTTGELAFSCGKFSAIGCGIDTHFMPTDDSERKNAAVAEQCHDISSEIAALAKQSYSSNPTKNTALFATNISVMAKAKQGATFSKRTLFRYRELQCVWEWVGHVESIQDEQISQLVQQRNASSHSVSKSLIEGWPLAGDLLTNVGTSSLLSAQKDKSNSYTESISKIDTNIGCPIYKGRGRALAMLALQWDPDFVVSDEEEVPSSELLELSPDRYALSYVINLCLLEGNFERAAALAVFHGDLRKAISVLQKGAHLVHPNESFHSSSAQTNSSDISFDKDSTTSERANLMQLVAMAIAGYTRSNINDSHSKENLWVSMCQELMNSAAIRSSDSPRYLHAICAFLHYAIRTPHKNNRGSQNAWNSNRAWSNGSTISMLQQRILQDETIPLSDRVAFACRYLPANELSNFVQSAADESESNGMLQGIILTGVNAQGMRLLQAYVDRTCDIQSVALICSRVNVRKEHLPKKEMWAKTYTDLLNLWRLWVERAIFDVGSAKYIDQQRKRDALMTSLGYKSNSSVSTKEDSKSVNSFSIPPYPQLLYLRCNYCSTTLSLDSLLRVGSSHSTWLSKSKPKLSCCPSCRKPLPQCALCLLPFGSLNPYYELATRRARSKAEVPTLDSSSSSTNDDMMGLSSIPFVEWTTWCQTCKHGGHAHHIAEWFDRHDICPVTDCHCRCRGLDNIF